MSKLSKLQPMNIMPFGEVVEERFEEGKEYGLLEMTVGIWRVTKKCRSNYDPISYIEYLRGGIEREQVKKVKEKTASRQTVIDDLLKL